MAGGLEFLVMAAGGLAGSMLGSALGNEVAEGYTPTSVASAPLPAPAPTVSTAPVVAPPTVSSAEDVSVTTAAEADVLRADEESLRSAKRRKMKSDLDSSVVSLESAKSPVKTLLGV